MPKSLFMINNVHDIVLAERNVSLSILTVFWQNLVFNEVDSMRLGKFALSSTTMLAAFVSATSASHAATLVDQTLDLVKQPYPAIIPLVQFCADEGGICEPGDSITFTSGGSDAITNNDTEFTFDKFIYQILSPDTQWGTVTSNTFDVTISQDSKTATFSNALVPPGEGIFFNRTISDRSAVQFRLTAVPEPTTILGTLAAGALGTTLLKRKKVAS